MDDYPVEDTQPPLPDNEHEDDTMQVDNHQEYDFVKDDPPPLDEPHDLMPTGDNEEECVADSTVGDEKLVENLVEHPPVVEDQEPETRPDSTVQMRTTNPFVCFVVSLYHNKNVNDLLLWKNIPITAGVLILFLYSAFSMALLSTLSVIGYYGLGIIICNIAIRLYRTILETLGKQQAASFFPLELVDRMSKADWQLPRECVLNAVGKACDSFNEISGDIRDIILVHSYSRTLKAAAILYFLTWIGSIFNLLSVIILVVLNLFYIPLLFAKFDIMNNKEINAAVQQVHGHYKNAVDTLVEKMPFLSKVFESKVKTS